MARATLGYLWNAPLGGHGATPSRAGHDARRPRAGRRQGRPNVHAAEVAARVADASADGEDGGTAGLARPRRAHPSGRAEVGPGASMPAFARDLSGRVRKRTLAWRMVTGRVRLRTRGARACA